MITFHKVLRPQKDSWNRPTVLTRQSETRWRVGKELGVLFVRSRRRGCARSGHPRLPIPKERLVEWANLRVPHPRSTIPSSGRRPAPAPSARARTHRRPAQRQLAFLLQYAPSATTTGISRVKSTYCDWRSRASDEDSTRQIRPRAEGGRQTRRRQKWANSMRSWWRSAGSCRRSGSG